MSNDMKEQIGSRQLQCPYCKETITKDYLDQYPFPELPCPCCGSLVERFSAKQNEMPLQNRRRDERFSVPLKVTYPNFKRFMIDYTKNVSKGGMFIKTRAPYEIGLQIDLSIYVPELEDPVKIMGRVVHNNFGSAGGGDAGIGVEFIDIDENSREILIKSVRQKTQCG